MYRSTVLALQFHSYDITSVEETTHRRTRTFRISTGNWSSLTIDKSEIRYAEQTHGFVLNLGLHTPSANKSVFDF